MYGDPDGRGGRAVPRSVGEGVAGVILPASLPVVDRVDVILRQPFGDGEGSDDLRAGAEEAVPDGAEMTVRFRLGSPSLVQFVERNWRANYIRIGSQQGCPDSRASRR